MITSHDTATEEVRRDPTNGASAADYRVWAGKKKNAEKMAQLKAKLEETTDPETKAKIAAVMKEQKLMSLEIGAKERMLQMKKLELALTKESDAAKKADMEKKLQVLKAESEEYLKKAEEVRKAEEKAKQAAEKK